MKKIKIASIALAITLFGSQMGAASAFAKGNEHAGKDNKVHEVQKSKKEIEKQKEQKKKEEQKQKQQLKVIKEINVKLAKLQEKSDKISKYITDFYAKAQTAERENDFYHSALVKIKSVNKELSAIEKQLNHIGKSDAISDTIQNLDGLKTKLSDMKASLEASHQAFIAANQAPVTQDPTDNTSPEQPAE